MALVDALSAVVGEKKDTKKGDGKHYIPFTKAEWALVAKAFGRDPEDFKPNGVKRVILAMAEGKFDIVAAKAIADTETK